jgi:hypothetical protein
MRPSRSREQQPVSRRRVKRSAARARSRSAVEKSGGGSTKVSSAGCSGWPLSAAARSRRAARSQEASTASRSASLSSGACDTGTSSTNPPQATDPLVIGAASSMKS